MPRLTAAFSMATKSPPTNQEHELSPTAADGSLAPGEDKGAMPLASPGTMRRRDSSAPSSSRREKEAAGGRADDGCDGFASNVASLYSSEWGNVLQIYSERYGRTYYLRGTRAEDSEVWHVGSVGLRARQADGR